MNLLSNAVKFSVAGEIRVELERIGDRMRLTVSDQGIGMTAEQIARLFRPFEQADGSTTRRFGGSGLGLAITMRLVHLLGGELAVDSRPGQGSRFTVMLPLIEAVGPSSPTLPAPPPTSHRLTGARVLVAEDNPINQVLLREMLEHEGARCELVTNGQEAVERVREGGEGAFDVVLMDVQMPVMDGYQATRLIHQQFPTLPVIGQTAHALAEERQSCLACGMVDFLAKPLDFEQVIARVARYRAPRAPTREIPTP